MSAHIVIAAVCTILVLQGCATTRPPDPAELEAVAGLTADELRKAIRGGGPECSDRRNPFATATPECRAVINAWLKRQDARRWALKVLTTATDEHGPPVPLRTIAARRPRSVR